MKEATFIPHRQYTVTSKCPLLLGYLWVVPSEFALQISVLTQFWLIGYKESFLEHIFSYVKKKQSLREGSRLPFSNANGVCDASTSVDILTSW